MAGQARKVWSPPLILALAVAALLLTQVAALAEEPDFDAATGYRIARYRSPVPDKVAGGTVISAADIPNLLKNQKAVLIDVMPSDGAGPDPATGEWRITKPRQNIPGSIWLPDVGKGEVTPQLDAYFRGNLLTLTAGNTAHPVIVYCQADCWMSWNAVKRASTYGYTSLFWYPEGSDGWRDWDGGFSDAKPVPLVFSAISNKQVPKP